MQDPISPEEGGSVECLNDYHSNKRRTFSVVTATS